MATGVFGWNELMTDNVESAKEFYTATVGWTFDEVKMGFSTYFLGKINGRPACGIMDMTGVAAPGVAPHWFSYILVDDLDARVAAVETSGGQVQRKPFFIPGIGRIAIITDSTGAAVGLMQRG
jgi:predicted enzyme related to lactoylglutathione lyase